ncbi:MAG: serine/threonine-protein phosphatase [Bacteroidia bacterium]|nr:serine/threonine-protein phosphatase [Bacteroidia bacterium]
MEDITIHESVVKEEFNRTTEKAHVIACWIGIVLNLVWFLGDYLSIPEYWIPFLNFRIAVSVISLIALMAKNYFKISIYTCIFILVLGISVQNAYMWSVMDIPHLQKHAFAYMVLFIGVGMLVLWEMKLSIILLVTTIISNIIFFVLNSPLTVDEFITNGGLLVLTVLIFCVFLIRNRYRLTYKEIKSRLELEKSKALIEIQKEEVDEKNQEIISSLRYAKRLQEALLPPKNLLESFFKENYFIIYNPRDIVCGDFYWARKIKTTPRDGKSYEFLLVAVADCTGHGVPGAFMSLLGSNFLHQSAVEKDVNTPAQALDFLNQKIITTLNHGYGEEKIRDGMDISLIAIDLETKQLAYSGANNPVYIVRNKSLETLKANKQAIGNMNEVTLPFDNVITQLQDGDCIYLFTDGYADQFGGPKGKKLMRKQFEEVLIENSEKTMQEQKQALENTYNNWKGNLEQVDDVCVVGIRI